MKQVLTDIVKSIVDNPDEVVVLEKVSGDMSLSLIHIFSIWCIYVIYKAVRDGGRVAVSRFLNCANHYDCLSESN